MFSILSVKHCSNVIYYGDYTGEMMFEVEEEKFNYDVDLKLKKNGLLCFYYITLGAMAVSSFLLLYRVYFAYEYYSDLY